MPGGSLQFLREGCPLNALAFAQAVKFYDSNADSSQSCLRQALPPKNLAKANVVIQVSH